MWQLAVMIFDLVKDFADVLDAMPGGHPRRRILKLLNDSIWCDAHTISEHPEHTAQTLYNRLSWDCRGENELCDAIEQGRNDLDQRQSWIQAAAPLNAFGGGTRVSKAYRIESQVHSVTPDGRLLAVGRAGDIDVYELPFGHLVQRISVSIDAPAALALNPDGHRVAYACQSGRVLCHDSQLEFVGGRRKPLLTWAADWIIAVSTDNSLVAWMPDTGQTTLLATDLPSPLIALKTLADQTTVLYCAGYRDQAVGILRWGTTGWVHHRIPYTGATIVAADLSSDGKRLLVASQDRHLAIVGVSDGSVTAQTAWEQRTEITSLRGRPERCAIGRRPDHNDAFLALSSGQLIAWNWSNDEIHQMASRCGVQSKQALCQFEALPQGALLLTFSDHAEYRDTSEDRVSTIGHDGAVNSVAIIGNRLLASASDQDRTLRWHTIERLELESVQSYHDCPPCTLARMRDSDDVLVGSANGLVWRNASGERVPRHVIDRLFTSRVNSLVPVTSTALIAASEHGQVRWKDLSNDEESLLCGSVPERRQIKILAAEPPTRYLSLYRDASNSRTVLSIITSQNQERIIWESQIRFRDVGTADHGNIICLTGEMVVVVAQHENSWVERFSRDSEALCADFIAVDLLAVLTSNARLEIWQIMEGLPTVASLPLNDTPTCLAVAERCIAIGLQSGRLHTFWFRHASDGARPVGERI